jgi:capsular exopolysaccharide synthesis family protein
MSRLFEALSKLKIDRRPLEASMPSYGAEVSNGTVLGQVGVDEADMVVVRPSPAAHLVALTEPDCLGSEKFRALVTRLDHLRKQHAFKSLQVTSSVVNEGKSLVAANLALTLARYSGSKTLLIEGDLRRPTLSSRFGLDGLQGLSHWWSQENLSIFRFLHRLNDMPLWFLAAGNTHDQSSAILRSTRFAEAFAEMAGEFDWIVVDSTPMQPVIDANLWSKLVDGTLLVVREGVTQVKALKQGLRALDHPKLVGVVINETLEVEQSSYDGGYYGALKQADSRPREGKVPEAVL